MTLKKNRRKLSKRQALLRCRNMWKWVEENISTHRQYYDDLKALYLRRMKVPRNERPFADCYACQYHEEHHKGRDCKGKDCILHKAWPWGNHGCLDDNSAYQLDVTLSSELPTDERLELLRKGARKIWMVAEAEMEKLPKPGKKGGKVL